MTMLFTREPSGKEQGTASATPLLDRFRRVREFSSRLCDSLNPEDCVIQSMPDVSPTRWHLAHTTWFFETFLLKPNVPNYRSPNEAFEFLFNSYYNGVGAQYPRAKRGLLSRPTVAEVFDYRREIDERVAGFLARADANTLERVAPIVELGLQHEQQHQELMLTDIKHVLSCNPLFPAYRPGRPGLRSCDLAGGNDLKWRSFEEGVRWIGHDPEGAGTTGSRFAFDNESPRHRGFLESFELCDRLVTCGEYLAFIEDGGYRTPGLWLSLGWAQVQSEGWHAPLYWIERDAEWFVFTLDGLRKLDPHEPVCHVSYFEADAFARWAGARLPSEAEWEIAADQVPLTGNFVESAALHPVPAARPDDVPGLRQMFGDVWEWTASPYVGYPGYRPPAGAIGEYNGKFMCNQYVLRGGSCATSQSHIRRTYRNFFPPEARWQFTGIRLAR